MTLAIRIPLPLLMVIDDVGWWSGEDGHSRGEPYRTGVGRAHVPSDYSALVSLGRRLGMRIQAAMALCEWDRDDSLRTVPTATWMGASWRNDRWRGPWLDEAAAILASGRDAVEITLHGVGHEYWTDGILSRAEWYDGEGRMRPPDQVRAHLDAFARLLAQNGLGGFPRSYVPAAFRHAFDPEGGGLSAILSEYGVRYLSTPFASMVGAARTPERALGVENGLLTLDRGVFPMNWRTLDGRPSGNAAGPILGLHWPNVLHEDPARNEEVVERWAAFVRPYARRPDRVLARDTAECWTQAAFHYGTEVRCGLWDAGLDFRRLDRLSAPGLGDTFAMRVEGAAGLRMLSPDLETLCDEPAEDGAARLLRVRRKPGVVRARLAFAP